MQNSIFNRSDPFTTDPFFNRLSHQDSIFPSSHPFFNDPFFNRQSRLNEPPTILTPKIKPDIEPLRTGEMAQVSGGHMGVPVLSVLPSPSPYPLTTDPCFTATAPYMKPPHIQPPLIEPQHIEPPQIEPPHIELPPHSG